MLHFGVATPRATHHGSATPARSSFLRHSGLGLRVEAYCLQLARPDEQSAPVARFSCPYKRLECGSYIQGSWNANCPHPLARQWTASCLHGFIFLRMQSSIWRRYCDQATSWIFPRSRPRTGRGRCRACPHLPARPCRPAIRPGCRGHGITMRCMSHRCGEIEGAHAARPGTHGRRGGVKRPGAPVGGTV